MATVFLAKAFIDISIEFKKQLSDDKSSRLVLLATVFLASPFIDYAESSNQDPAHTCKMTDPAGLKIVENSVKIVVNAQTLFGLIFV